MAPFNKAKVRPGSNNQRARGGALGRGIGGRGRRGERAPRTGDGKKSSFKSTRIAEKAEDGSDHSDEPSHNDASLKSSSDDLSSDEEDAETAVTAIKPYSVLLRSLNDHTQPGQPPRKRQKPSELVALEESDAAKKDLDLVIEPEDVDDPSVDEVIDDDGDDAEDEGMSQKCR